MKVINELKLMLKYLVSNPKHPRYKKGVAKHLKFLVEKDVKSNGLPGLLLFIGLKVLVMMTSLQNIVILGTQGLLMLMGSKCLIKMTRLQNI